jgi:hypothetical protein
MQEEIDKLQNLNTEQQAKFELKRNELLKSIALVNTLNSNIQDFELYV